MVTIEHPPGRGAVVLSIVAAVVTFSASVAGLLVDGVYGEPAAVAEMLRAYDLVTLTVVVPGLAASLVGVRRGSDLAHLLWTGLLAYLAYTYSFYAFGAGFNDLFLLHVTGLGTSVFALVLSVSALDVPGIASRFDPRTPRRAVAAVLAVLAAGLGGLWIYHVIANAVTGVVPAGSALVEPDAVVHLGISLDLALLVPAYGLAAVLLWRRASWGYPSAALLLVSGTLHQLSYLVAMPFQAWAGIPGAVMTDPGEPVVVLLYAVGTGLLLSGAGRARASLARSPRTGRAS